MNEQINMLLELLEEIKQQNRELKTTVCSIESKTDTAQPNHENSELLKLKEAVNLLLESNMQRGKQTTELNFELVKLFNQLRVDVTNSTETQRYSFEKLTEILQISQSPPVTKKYYLFDVKRWMEWALWIAAMLLVSGSIGWSIYLQGSNQRLHDYALRYRILRMEHSLNTEAFTHLDSLFEHNRSNSEINALRKQVISYEKAIRRQAELLQRQQQLSAEQEKVRKQLKR